MKKIKDFIKDIETLRTLVALSVSFLIVFILIIIISDSPTKALFDFIIGPFTSIRRFGNVIEGSLPLIFTGLSVILLQRTGHYNLAMEGAFFIGAVVATAAALIFKGPPLIILLVSMLSAMLIGAIITGIPAVLKVKTDANVLVTSLMLNHICLYVGMFIIITYFQDPKMNSNYSYMFPDGVNIPTIFGVTRINYGMIIALITVFIVWFLLNKTSFGYKLTIVGKNQNFAKYSGINVNRLIIESALIGGAIAGLGGAVDLFGMYNRFQYSGLTNYGWDGILIAIVARHKPHFVPFAALFLSYLRTGANILSRTSDIPSEMISIIQAIVIVLISAQAILSKYRQKLVVEKTLSGEVI
ncbi:MAG: ABC transporter permease [Erysipelotrichaceae bacterium]|nr:ABC transporter permease [Erysipelotrichaceae bacterium]